MRVPSAQRAPRRRAGANAADRGVARRNWVSAEAFGLGARDRGRHRDVDHDASIRCAAATKDLSRAGVGATRALRRSETRVEHDVSPRRSWDHGQRIE
jgi:hypothetical protein